MSSITFLNVLSQRAQHCDKMCQDGNLVPILADLLPIQLPERKRPTYLGICNSGWRPRWSPCSGLESQLWLLIPIWDSQEMRDYLFLSLSLSLLSSSLKKDSESYRVICDQG